MSKATARKATTPKSSKKIPAPMIETMQPAWVVDMHRHFGVHGYYRPSDLNRVLGNPAGHTSGQAVSVFAFNGKK